MNPGFEWDPAKEHLNFAKHGIRFVQAITALEDENALTIEDAHDDEQRFITLGLDEIGRLLVVVYTYRGEMIRIISARKATPNERKVYESEQL